MYTFAYKLICAWKILYSLSGMNSTELTMPRFRMRGAMFVHRGLVLSEAKEQH